jgi:hypothetical protein
MIYYPSNQTTLSGSIIEKKFGVGWTKEDWENYYSDMQDHIDIVEEGLRRAGL